MDILEKKTRDILKKFGIKANKRLGQNFLIKQKVIDKIIEAGKVTKNDLVIEVGPGLGGLTARLCIEAGSVIAIELDRRFITILEDVLGNYNNYKIIHGDILDIDLRSLLETERFLGEVKVVANLPYYITTPVIMKLLEEELGLNSIVVMVQKEVADRITAKPGGKEYGALTIAISYYGTPSIVYDVPPSSFVPEPGVNSSVIRIDLTQKPSCEIKDKKLFFKIIKAAFSQRRKTIQNSLANSGIFEFDKENIKILLNSAGISEQSRPETISFETFAAFSNIINNYEQKV